MVIISFKKLQYLEETVRNFGIISEKYYTICKENFQKFGVVNIF